jgi:predicted transcriptional regulator
MLNFTGATQVKSPVPTYISQAEAARLLEVSEAAVTKAIKQGRLDFVMGEDGRRKIDRDTLAVQWTANSQRKINVGPKQTHERRVTRSTMDVPDYNESRARTEHLKAELLELQRREKEGQLIDAEKLRKDSFALGNQMKELLMGIADRLAHMCAAEDDPAKVHQYITEEHRNALRAFCDAAD